MESASKKDVSFEKDQTDLDDKFEELKRPVYKGKKLDDPVASAVVLPLRCSKLTSG
jgi:hypothetical protein